MIGIYSSPNRDPRMHAVCVTIEAEVTGTFTAGATYEIIETRPFFREEIANMELSHDHSAQFENYLMASPVLA